MKQPSGNAQLSCIPERLRQIRSTQRSAPDPPTATGGGGATSWRTNPWPSLKEILVAPCIRAVNAWDSEEFPLSKRVKVFLPENSERMYLSKVFSFLFMIYNSTDFKHSSWSDQWIIWIWIFCGNLCSFCQTSGKLAAVWWNLQWSATFFEYLLEFPVTLTPRKSGLAGRWWRLDTPPESS